MKKGNYNKKINVLCGSLSNRSFRSPLMRINARKTHKSKLLIDYYIILTFDKHINPFVFETWCETIELRKKLTPHIIRLLAALPSFGVRLALHV